MERCVIPAGAMDRKGTISQKDKSIPAGTVLVPHWDDYDAPGAEKLFHLFPGGIFEALRSMMHALFGYGARGKHGELRQIDALVKRIDAAVDTLLQRHELMPFAVEKAQQELASIATDLDTVRNRRKVNARDALVKSSALTISYRNAPRRNVPATIRRIDGAKNRLGGRSREIHHIVPHVAFFEQALASEIGRMIRGLENAVVTLLVESSRLERRKTPYSEGERRIFFRRYRDVGAVLENIRCVPFLRAAHLARADMGEAAKFLDAGNYGKAALSLKRAARGLKCKLAQVYFERTIVFPMSLRIGLGVFSAADAERFAKKLTKIRISADARLDDEGFRAPVKMRFISAIGEAIISLEAGEYRAAKDKVKRASRAL